MIQVKNVSKIFNEGTPKAFTALDDISLHVKKGEVSLLKGISGSGKSTLLSLFAGLYQPSKGEILIDGEAISQYPENFASRFRRNNIGFIFQKFNLISTLTVLENVLLPTLPDDIDKLEEAMELLELFNISSKTNVEVKHLSGGEQQRVAVIRALINDPKLILADEPTANLDQALSIKILDYFEKIINQEKTLVIATHDPLLLEWGNYETCFEMKNGKLL
ncbi:ABC transporter ATP-binding protein [Arcobacter arenosus]|uniref:ABC transporter ATP-binding protein n=1 Tax=Arcobacter arenosus TaxID=2576037 RepID=A0A5R8Y421_9BACT|nr:ABC transporter ATP-binding protein [Arcobacter arenosus]TLP40845.1 ABC transporter ATP-binding protein [Arcobacter arenosus]